MRKLKVLIIDDEPIAQDILEAYVTKVPELELIAKCDNAIQAYKFIQEEDIDLMFLDIQMPEINGVDFLKTLKDKPKVVFTTAYSEYAMEGYDLDIIDYLLKPISFERFLKSVHKVYDLVKLEEGLDESYHLSKDYVFLKDGHEQIKVFLDDILYCEGLKDYVQVYLKDGKKIVTLCTMKNMEEEILAAKNFLRIHRSYIINLEKVVSVIGNNFKINGQIIGVGKSYVDKVKAYVKF
jgi:DNA-binding LytR/AlgR family response regulator